MPASGIVWIIKEQENKFHDFNDSSNLRFPLEFKNKWRSHAQEVYVKEIDGNVPIDVSVIKYKCLMLMKHTSKNKDEDQSSARVVSNLHSQNDRYGIIHGWVLTEWSKSLPFLRVLYG